MSARKVVISFSTAFGLAATFAAAHGAPAKKAAKRNETVGELLKRIETNTKKVSFSKSNAALPSFKKSQAPAPLTHENLAKIKPPSHSAFYYDENTNEAELARITDQGINQLYKLTQQFKNSKRRGELWLRLAELYVEKARLIEFRTQQKYDNELRDYQAGKSKVKPVLNLKVSQEYNAKAIQLYEWFLRDYPKDPKVDQALFFLGYNYFELDKPEKGKDYYKRLTTDYPHSAYIEESNFALGEYYFDRENWKEAEKHYDAVAANHRARLYSFALYKEAWCQYKTGQVKVALTSLEKVIRAGRIAKGQQDHSTSGVGRIRLATEAQKDLVVFYAEAGTAKGARAYFSQVVGDKQVFNLLEKLAYYYADIGNREDARFLFRDLIAERPTAPKAYDYQYQIVSMYTSTEKGEVYRAELYNWIQNYSPNSEWAKANAKDKQLVAKASQLIETTLRNHILQQHQTAKNSRVPAAQQAAKAGYELYFQTMQPNPHTDEMHFFYAELLFDMQDFELAAKHYNWVAEHAPKSKYYELSSLNTVLSLEKKLPTEEQLKKNIGEKLDAVPFSPVVANFEGAAGRYVTNFPKGEYVPAIKYKMAALYYYHNQFDKALTTFNEIIKQYPKSPYAQYAANLTLDIYNLRKDYGGLEKAGEQILANEDLAKSSVGLQVKNVLQRASFKKAQDLEAKKDYPAAAAAYEDFAKKNGASDLAVPASFNAAVNYEKAGDLSKAIAMYGFVLADRSGKHDDLKKQSGKFMGELHQLTGQYKQAAADFESWAVKNPKEKDTPSFYYNAAVIRDGMNSYAAALNNYQKYFDMSRGADKWEAIFLMAKLWERRGGITKAQQLYKQFYDARPRNSEELIESAFRVAKIFAMKGNKKDSEDWYKKVIYQQKHLSTKDHPIGASYAAEAKYILVSKTFDDLRSIRIPANPAKQARAVKEKVAILLHLKDQLKEVIRYDDAYMVVNSLTLIGQAYQHMAASIYAVPLPKGLSADDTKKYKAGVDKVAQPFTDEAVKNYQAAIERGFKLEGYNDGLKTAERELNRLKSDQYPDYGEKAVITKEPDLLKVEKDDALGNVWKAKDETLLVEAVAKILGKDQNNLLALNTLANFYISQGKLGMGKVILARAEKAHATEPAIQNNLGVIALGEGNQRAAIAYFRKAEEISKGYPAAAANLGSIFVEYKDYAKAVQLLEDGYDSVKGDLSHGVAMDVANDYALALSGSGNLDRAKDIFQDILKAESQNTVALMNYTILLVYRLKDKKEGEKMLNRLKFLADDAASQKRINELDKALNEK